MIHLLHEYTEIKRKATSFRADVLGVQLSLVSYCSCVIQNYMYCSSGHLKCFQYDCLTGVSELCLSSHNAVPETLQKVR
jgi:hypothetical protein